MSSKIPVAAVALALVAAASRAIANPVGVPRSFTRRLWIYPKR